MFDANFFLRAVAWVLAIGGTFSTIAGLWYLWWSNFTVSGKMDVLRDRIRGRVWVFSFRPMVVAIIGWIAVFSFSSESPQYVKDGRTGICYSYTIDYGKKPVFTRVQCTPEVEKQASK